MQHTRKEASAACAKSTPTPQDSQPWADKVGDPPRVPPRVPPCPPLGDLPTMKSSSSLARVSSRYLFITIGAICLLSEAGFAQGGDIRVPEINGGTTRTAVTVLFLGMAMLIRPRALAARQERQ